MISRVIILLTIYSFVVAVCAGVNAGFKSKGKQFDKKGYYTMLCTLITLTLLIATIIYFQNSDVGGSEFALFALTVCVSYCLIGRINKDVKEEDSHKEDNILAVVSSLLFVIVGVFSYFNRNTVYNSVNKLSRGLNAAANGAKDTVRAVSNAYHSNGVRGLNSMENLINVTAVN